MDLQAAIRTAKERIILNSLRQESITSPVRAQFIQETTEALQVLVDFAERNFTECKIATDYNFSGWISVDDKLPCVSGKYITWHISSEYGTGILLQRYNSIDQSWVMAAEFGGEVSHWQPLPAEPEGR